jgi:hypothetical protein
VTETVGSTDLSEPQAAIDPASSAGSTYLVRIVAFNCAYFPLMDPVPPLAHLAHWYMWVLYLVPVLIVVAASIHALVAQRREDRERAAGERHS